MKLAEIYEVMVDSLFATDAGANRLERNPSWTPSVDCGCWFSMDSPESLHLLNHPPLCGCANYLEQFFQ